MALGCGCSVKIMKEIGNGRNNWQWAIGNQERITIYVKVQYKGVHRLLLIAYCLLPIANCPVSFQKFL